MKHEDIHRRALRATAKIALSLTVIGCGGRVEVPASEGGGGSGPETSGGGAPYPTTTSSGITTTTTTQNEGGAGGAPGFCSATQPGEPISIDPTAFGCCTDYLGDQPEAAWLTPGAELTACCYEVIGQIDMDPSLQASVDPALVAPVWPEKQQPSCCDVLGNPCTAPCGCIVWGPPVPRALRGTLWSLDALEHAMLEAA